MTSKGRYTLVIENEHKNLIPVSDSNTIKVDLASIDCYTTKFSTPQQLIENLKNREITVKGHGFGYVLLRRAFSRKGVKIVSTPTNENIIIEIENKDIPIFKIIYKDKIIAQEKSIETIVKITFVYLNKKVA